MLQRRSLLGAQSQRPEGAADEVAAVEGEGVVAEAPAEPLRVEARHQQPAAEEEALVDAEEQAVVVAGPTSSR